MRGRKTLYIFAAIFTVIGLYFIWKSYEKYSFRREGQQKVVALNATLAEKKTEMLNAYERRLLTLEKWAELEKTRVKKLPSDLDFGPEIAEVKGMIFQDYKEAARFDYLQEKVREKVGQYMRFNPSDEKLEQMQAVEQDINRTRKEYHSTAREIISVQSKYNLPKDEPLMFPAEKNEEQDIILFQ